MSKTVELARHLETLHINNMYKSDFYWTWDKSDEEIDAVFTVADALRAQGAKVYQTAYQKAAQDGYTQVASSRAEQAMKSFYYEMYRSGVMDEETYELLTR